MGSVVPRIGGRHSMNWSETQGAGALTCWRLDRLGRNLEHLIALLEELQALGVAFVSLAEGIDATTPAGKLQMHILGAIAEFERARIVERVRAGFARAKAQGTRLGRPTTGPPIAWRRSPTCP